MAYEWLFLVIAWCRAWFNMFATLPVVNWHNSLLFLLFTLYQVKNQIASFSLSCQALIYFLLS